MVDYHGLAESTSPSEGTMSAMILAMMTIVGALHPKGTMGRLLAPYFLCATAGALLSYFEVFLWGLLHK